NEVFSLRTSRELTLRLERSKVKGEVLGGDDRLPVVGALVDLSRRDESDSVVEGMIATGTDGSGGFYLPRVSPGRYQLRVRKAGYEPHVSEVEVSPGSDLEGLKVVLEPTPGLELDVRLASGGWPCWVSYEVHDASGRPVVTANARLDAQGRAHLASVPPGDWQVWVGAPGVATVLLRARVPVQEPVPVVLGPAGRLEIRIPALVTSNLLATLTLADASRGVFSTFDEAGRLRSEWQVVGGKTTIDRLPAGSWVLRARAADGRLFQATATTFGEAVSSISME
ncbi:MAG: carboxypeptidase-like regulatory domain-containing protein, partial [Holophagales bacterium]|nr:carboxypeptidase-like regulatory domain-containing protein [Holophagales bacterium]